MDSHNVNIALLKAEDHFRKAKTASTPEIAAVHQSLGDTHLSEAQAMHAALAQFADEAAEVAAQSI